MEWSSLPWSPTHRQLRQFSVLWLVFVSGAAIWNASRLDAGVVIVAFAAVSILIGGLGLRFPVAIRPIWVASLAATFPIGWVASRVLLWLLYFGLLTPLGLFLRWRGHDSLNLGKQDREQPTHWKERPSETAPAQYLQTY